MALLSVLLAGCPIDHGGRTPCEWVHDQVQGNRLFDLLARRIPSILFGATRPYGLEGLERDNPSTVACRRDQISALETIDGLLSGTSPVRHALAAVTRPSELSTDVGVERLLGPDGAIPKLSIPQLNLDMLSSSMISSR